MNYKLHGKVNAVNRAHELASEWYYTLTKVFAPLVGKQITKVDGSLLGKVKKLLPELPCTGRTHIFHYSNMTGLLCFLIKVSEPDSPPLPDGSGGHTVTYYEQLLRIGNREGDRLVSLLGPCLDWNNRWTAEQVERLREEYRAAAKVADEAKSRLYPFGEYDR